MVSGLASGNQDVRAAVFICVAMCAAERLRDRNQTDRVRSESLFVRTSGDKDASAARSDNIGPTALAHIKSLTGFPFVRPTSIAGVQTVNWTRCSGSRDDF